MEAQADTMQGIGRFMAGILPPDRPAHQRNFFERFALRFVFLYFFLSAWMWLDELVTGQTFFIRGTYNAVGSRLIPWVAKHLLHISGVVEKRNLHDSVYFCVELLCWVVVSVVLAFVWSLWDRRGRYDPLWHDLLRIFLRYTLAWIMVIYAWNKIINVQFKFPELPRLVEAYGDSSPMALLWFYMSYSHPYVVFGGLAELAGAVCLLFRRTTTLGALILLGVVGNVTFINFAYDISVKFLSLNLFLMVCVLLVPEVSRLTNFLVLNRPVEPLELGGEPRDRRFRMAKLAVKGVILADLLLPMPYHNVQRYKVEGPNAPKPPLYGIYSVEGLTEDGQSHPPLLTDTERWRYVIIDSTSNLVIRRMDDSAQEYAMTYDAKARRMTLQSEDSQPVKGVFAVSQAGPDSLQLQGNLGNDTLSLQLRRLDEKKMTLISRGFHWISEKSFYK
jgi:hypothetical protein